MLRKSILWVLASMLLCVNRGTAAPTLETARGQVDKVTRDSLVIQQRLPDGKFGKSLTLRVTGTTKISILSTRMQGRSVVLVQRDAELRDLKPDQRVAVIYVTGKESAVLLAAVVLPPGAK